MARRIPPRHQNKPKIKLKLKIKKDDNVKVIAGRDKGKTGRVLRGRFGQRQSAGRGRQRGEAPHAPQPAKADQGRHRRAREPDCGLERDGADRGRRGQPGRLSPRRRRSSVRVAKKGGEIVGQEVKDQYGGTAQRVISQNSGSGAHRGVRVHEPHGGAEDRKDFAQHRHGRGHAEQQTDRRRGERADGHRRPEAGDHQGPQVDCRLQAAREHADRLHGYAARGADVRVSRPAGERGPAARARFPRRVFASPSTAAETTRWD